MNSLQIGFLIFLLLPPIFSIALDKISNRVNGVRWIEWSESIFSFYVFGIIIAALVFVYLILGKL